ncbi:MAG: hypothetical protein FJZ90_02485 [Chloroflexi bacterium]|nr:hypothetical protein [Chloroflexota bacterium]
MIDLDVLRPYHERYSALEVRPLIVRLMLKPGARLAGYDPLNLDNLLARCVVDAATDGHGLEPIEEPYSLPVPLRCLWRDDRGLPLWATTPLLPHGAEMRDIHYWHKRAQTGRFTHTKSGRFIITSTKGRWMERRVPLPIQIADHWEATCVGNAVEIGRLLDPLVHVGKRRAMGLGEISHWEIEPAEAFYLVDEDRLTRALPAMAIELLGGYMPMERPSPVGWTPPQWKPSLFAPGWRVGATIARDWYAAS